jgi:hypothetical protein
MFFSFQRDGTMTNGALDRWSSIIGGRAGERSAAETFIDAFFFRAPFAESISFFAGNCRFAGDPLGQCGGLRRRGTALPQR